MRLLLFAFLGLFTSLSRAGEPVLIAAAADLKFAFDDVLAEFSKTHPELEPKVTYGSSGTLTQQIENGAPFDLFLSADAKLPRRLIEGGQADKASFFLYAQGHLVIWVPTASKLDLAKLGLRALLEPGVRKVAIANPEVAPYGAAAMAALKGAGLVDAVKPRLVLGENVAQTAQFVQSGAADAGIISLSLALAPKMKADGRHWEIPADGLPPIEQGVVIMTKSAHRAGAEAIAKYLRSERGMALLERYGFTRPAPAK
ncbi:MAG TPA: molybdate ABC transporter substrate-binding protein [Chthoniobacteraceae bacterium]|jgi:molybdate transport system substrate-binding protein|nr:molybdate ABC transporter substrate-binding protein [Chthoniobacteraceae bacterium]